MEYESYEPDVDEFYDQACPAAYAAMFSREGSVFCGNSSESSFLPVRDADVC